MLPLKQLLMKAQASLYHKTLKYCNHENKTMNENYMVQNPYFLMLFFEGQSYALGEVLLSPYCGSIR